MSALTSLGRKRLRRERDRLEEEAEESSEINLVPYLDMVTNILLFLIATIQAMVVVGNIEVNVPQYAQSSASLAKKSDTEKPDLSLTVTITGLGFTVAGSGATLGIVYQDDVPGKLPTIPKINGDRFDFERLQKLIVKIKSQYPDEQQAILSANPDILYETVIGVMDVLREGPDKKPLFPTVLFSTGIQ